MNQLNPYLSFTGACREALTFYQACFGGELKWMTVADTPMAAQMPAEAQAHIMHATLTTDRFKLIGSDMPGLGGHTPGHSIALFLECSSAAETQALYAELAAGGQVLDPLGVKFWGGLFGVVIDRFGVEWRLSLEP